MSNATGFDRIVYLGDSLTDNGGLFAASSAVGFFGIPPLAAGYAGQFSNGAVYSQLVPDLIGAEGGAELNFAIGGAQALTDRTIEDFFVGTGFIRPDATAEDLAFRVDFKGQVDRFLSGEGAEGDLGDTAVSIFIGLNDYNDFVPTSVETAGPEAFAYGIQVASTALADAQPLLAAGVGTIILHTNPLVTVFPSTNGAGADEQLLFGAVDAGFNSTIRAGAAELEAAGVDVKLVDFAAIFADVDADSESYGFRIFEEQVLLGDNGADGINPAVVGVPLDQIGFFDAVHPTEAFHGILAGFQSESLTSDVQIGGGEDDRIKGGRDDDLVLGADGDDFVRLRSGDDVGIGGLGEDIVLGGRGSDLVAGGGGNDVVAGGKGDDLVVGGEGNDILRGGKGDDVLIGSNGEDFASGGRGDDLFIFTESSLLGDDPSTLELVLGGRGHDTLVLRVEDAEADLGIHHVGRFVQVDALNIVGYGIEEVVVVENTDLSGEDFYNDTLAQADLWNFV
ncbi:MAG: SGNH/GDSL hydrolase family protein [Pseudomonadota bacterium]